MEAGRSRSPVSPLIHVVAQANLQLRKQPIVVGMGAYPEPYEPVERFDGKGAVVSPDPDRPEAADLLEMERRMTRVSLQPRVRVICEVPDMWGQGPIARQEIRRGVVSQRGVVLSAACSRRAFSARSSSRPA